MISEGPRYEFFPDPAELWLVWDKTEEGPTCLGGRVLMGLSRTEAEMFCVIMNDLDASLSKLGAKGVAA